MAHQLLINATALMLLVLIQYNSARATNKPNWPAPSIHDAEGCWTYFKQLNGRNFTNKQEDLTRGLNFELNRKLIIHNNQKVANETQIFNLIMSNWADLTDNQLEASLPIMHKYTYLNGRILEGPAKNGNESSGVFLSNAIEEAIDWRDHMKVMNHVKDQGNCGSCWAYSITGMMEAQLAKQNGNRWETLNADQLVTCLGADCQGYYMDAALEGLLNTRLAVMSDRVYSSLVDGHEGNKGNKGYISKQTCLAKMAPCGLVRLTDWRQIEISRTNLKQQLAKFGPIAVVVASETFLPMLKRLEHAIVDDLSCPAQTTKMSAHAMLLIGHGRDQATGEYYWLVKNSWGAGQAPFIRLPQDRRACLMEAYVGGIELLAGPGDGCPLGSRALASSWSRQ